MIRDDHTPSMLDDILTEANEDFAMAQRKEQPRIAKGAFDDVDALASLSDEALCRVLAEVQRDDLLTVLSAASDGLRRRVLTNLSRESSRWIEQNLAYFDTPTRALLSAGRGRVLAIANRLAASGSIAVPASEVQATQPSEGPFEAIVAVTTALLARVKERGPGVLADVVRSIDDPMLEEAFGLIARGADEATLRVSLDRMRDELMTAYAQRLDVTREAALALHRGEDPDAFRRRISMKR